MYLNGGEYNGIRLLSRTTVEAIMSNQIGNIWGETSEKNMGLAFYITTRQGQDKGGMSSDGTFYWGGYFNTQYFADPKEKIIGVIMKQTQGAKDDTGWMFRQLVGQSVDD